MDWAQTKDITTSIQNIVASTAFVIGGTWAYYRFVRFRTAKPRIEFSFDFDRSAVTDENRAVGILRAKVSNKGNTKVDLRKNGNNRCYLKYGLIEAANSGKIVSVISKPSTKLKRIDNVFVAHGWIEPNETLDDVKVISTPIGKRGIIQLEIEIFGYYKSFFRERKIRWAASTAFPLAGDAATSSFTSEDEQDPYEEAEVSRADMETKLHKIEEKLEASTLSANNELHELILRARHLLASQNRSLTELDELVRALSKHADQ